jgi:hypothetical protein
LDFSFPSEEVNAMRRALSACLLAALLAGVAARAEELGRNLNAPPIGKPGGDASAGPAVASQSHSADAVFGPRSGSTQSPAVVATRSGNAPETTRPSGARTVTASVGGEALRSLNSAPAGQRETILPTKDRRR